MINKKTIRPEDILPDEINSAEIAGVQVRKGTVAAVLANADILTSEDSTQQDKDNALSLIKELAPAIVAIGLHRHVSWKNKEAQAR